MREYAEGIELFGDISFWGETKKRNFKKWDRSECMQIQLEMDLNSDQVSTRECEPDTILLLFAD